MGSEMCIRDRTIKVWGAGDAVEDKEPRTLRGHAAWVVSVAWSPDGKHIASGSHDDTVKVWEVADGKELYTLQGHKNWVRSVAWSPNGRHIASGSLDKTVKVWQLPK